MVPVKYLLIICVFFIVRCGPDTEPIPPTVDPPKPQIDTLWTAYIPTYSGDTAYTVSIVPSLYENKVIVSSHRLFERENEVLSAFDSQTGKLLWTWNDYLETGYPDAAVVFLDMPYQIQNNQLLYATKWGMYLIDVITGKTLDAKEYASVQHTMGDGGVGSMGYIFGKMFRVYLPNRWTSVDCRASLYSSELSQINLEFEFEMLKDQNYCPTLDVPNGFYNKNGEKCLFGTVLQGDDRIPEYTGDFYSYNYDQKKMNWYSKGVIGNSILNAYPIVIGDKGYVMAIRDFYCIDLETGKIEWTKTFDGYSFAAPILHDGSRIFLTAGTGNMFCLDAKDGEILWTNASERDKPGSPNSMFYFEGRIYIGDSRLMIIDANSGRTLYNINSPLKLRPKGERRINVANIDPVNRLLYFTDGYHLICAKIPK